MSIDWASKSTDEILADVLDLVNAINREQAAYLPDPMPAMDARQAAAWLGIRRTRSGLWTIGGKRYRSRRLAVEAVTDWYATALTRAGRAAPMG